MKQQNGSSLIVALILLSIISLVAVYSLEGSNIQSKMVANSLFSALTYQECRNEQEAQIHYYEKDGNRDALLDIAGVPPQADDDGNLIPVIIEDSDTLTEAYAQYGPKSELNIVWRYIQLVPAARGGYDIDTESPSKSYLFENDCFAKFRFSQNSQTLGASVSGLVNPGNIK